MSFRIFGWSSSFLWRVAGALVAVGLVFFSGWMTSTALGTEFDRVVIELLEREQGLVLEEASLVGLADHLHDRLQINIVVDYKALEEDAISPETRVSVDLPTISLKSALKLALPR